MHKQKTANDVTLTTQRSSVSRVSTRRTNSRLTRYSARHKVAFRDSGATRLQPLQPSIRLTKRTLLTPCRRACFCDVDLSGTLVDILAGILAVCLATLFVVPHA